MDFSAQEQKTLPRIPFLTSHEFSCLSRKFSSVSRKRNALSPTRGALSATFMFPGEEWPAHGWGLGGGTLVSRVAWVPELKSHFMSHKSLSWTLNPSVGVKQAE